MKLKKIVKFIAIVMLVFFYALLSSKTRAIYRELIEDTIGLNIFGANSITITLNSNGGSSVGPIYKNYNETVGILPTPTKANNNFVGWYQDPQLTTPVLSSTVVTQSTTYYAKWTEIVCRIVENDEDLHRETCSGSSGGCKSSGISFPNNEIKYGSIYSAGSPIAGDAFDCDVNYDGVFDQKDPNDVRYTERFYFVREKENNNGENTAVLVYYTSIDANGRVDQSSGTDDIGSYGYTAALPYLPTSSSPLSWDNPTLVDFGNGVVTRFPTVADLEAVCGPTSNGSANLAYFVSCNKWFFFESSRFHTPNAWRSGIWFEYENEKYHRLQTSSVVLANNITATSANTVRPVIEIPMSALEGFKNATKYTIDFNTHEGTSVSSIERYNGEAIGEIPATTREHYTFDGWYATYENGTYSNPVTSSTVVNGDMTLHAKWIAIPTSTVTFDANGGTINGESTFDLVVDTGSTIDENDYPEAIYAGHTLDGWYLDDELTEPFDETEPITDDITLYASWVFSNYVARVNGTGYETLALAIDAVPTGKVKTTVTILQNITLSEAVTIPNTKWVELDGGNHTISGTTSLINNNGNLDIISGTISTSNLTATNTLITNGSNAILNISGGTLANNCYVAGATTEFLAISNVTSSGTVNITGGTITSYGQSAAINNKGNLNVSGGEIIAHNVTKGQAIYMDAGTVNISGDAYLENMSGTGDSRACVDNNGGTLNITGGTIVSKGDSAVRARKSGGKVFIGDDDDLIDITTPVMRGKTYGLEKANNGAIVEVYDGIFESLDNTRAVSGAVTKPDNIDFTDSTIDVDGVTYHSTYLLAPSITVRFFPENGGNTISIDVTGGDTIGALMPADPTKTDYYFGGWYDNDTLITSSTRVTSAIDAYARWVKSINTATISSSMNVEVESSENISITGTDLEGVTYSSSDDTVATVSSSGVVTGVNVGSATITITGKITGDTRTVTVTVNPIMHTVKFYDDDYDANDLEHSTLLYTVQVANDTTIGNNMPADPTKTNYVLNEWYINGNSNTPFTNQVTVTGDLVVVANWKEKITYATLSTVPSPLSIVIGGTGQINLSATDQGGVVESYTFATGDSSIATVSSSGEVTAAGVGNTNITITGSLSGVTRTVPVTVSPLKHTVTFKDGTTTLEEIEVVDGEKIGTLMPSNPVKNNYLFDAWYINGESLYPVSSETVVNGNMIVVASWTPSIQLATVPATLSVTIGETNTISVTGPSGMESYTFASSDDTIASVDANGVVSGVALGTTNVTITGSRSNTTRTVEVTVVNVAIRTVTFYSDYDPNDLENSTVLSTVSVSNGSSLGQSMPADPSRTDYIFNGWFINGNGLTPFTSSTAVSADVNVVASWKEKITIATIPAGPLSVRLGSSKEIVVTATGGGLVEDYTLSSSNTNLLEVNGKTIIGADVGSVTLTITGVESGLARTITVNVVNSYNVTFDPDNEAFSTVIQVPNGSSIDDSGETLPSDPTKSGYVFDNWYLYDEVNETLTTTRLDTTASITSDMVYKAKWVADTYYVAVYGATTTYHTTLQAAFNAVPTSGVATEVKILQDIVNPSGQSKVDSGRSVILNGGSHSVTCGSSTTNQMIFNTGSSTLRIISGTYSCGKDKLATLENSSGSHLYIDGGFVEQTSLSSNANARAAIFNNGSVEISGGTLKSNATQRGVVQNAGANASIIMSGGTVIQTAVSTMGALHNYASSTSITITGGTVTSVGDAINNVGGTLVIGTQNGAYDVTSPVIQGDKCGVTSTSTYSIFDGIIKGKSSNRAVNSFDMINETTGIEAGSTRTTGTDGAYYTLYYTIADLKYHINFNANDGEVTPSYLEFDLNEPITASDLPTPTRANNTFGGWYTDSNLETPFATFTPNSVATVTYYAKWTFNSSFTPVSHNILSNAMQDYFANVSSWVATDATDPSNEPPGTVPPQTQSASVNYDNGHSLFKASISSVFTSNGCSYCGADNSCSSPQSGTYCDYAEGYDTGLTDDLNVYFYENGEKSENVVSYVTSTGGVIYNMIPGVTYLWESATDNTKYGVVTATGNRRTLKTAVRNLRDMGGLAASNSDVSGTIDYGRLYRGAQITSAQGVTDLTKLGVTREIDLRGNNDGNQTYKMDNYDTGTKNSYTEIAMTNYIINPAATTYITTAHLDNYRAVKSSMREVMEKVVFNNDSIFFHCTIGTDRTGTLAYFLEGLLGVSEEDRLRDYELTYFFGLTNRNRFHDSVGWSGTNPRFYSMYRSYPTNQDIYNYYTYESHTPDPNNPNDLTDDELLRRFRLALIH